jgi:LPXTG-motif cell wall-anchored protein
VRLVAQLSVLLASLVLAGVAMADVEPGDEPGAVPPSAGPAPEVVVPQTTPVPLLAPPEVLTPAPDAPSSDTPEPEVPAPEASIPELPVGSPDGSVPETSLPAQPARSAAAPVPALAVVKVAAPEAGSSAAQPGRTAGSPAPAAGSAGRKAARTGSERVRAAVHRTLEERFPPGNPCDADPFSTACIDFVNRQDECRDSASAACARAIDQLSSRACLDDPASVECERLIADVQILCRPAKTSGSCSRYLDQIDRFLPCFGRQDAPGCEVFTATHLRLCNQYPGACGRGLGGTQEATGPRGAAPDRTIFASASDPGSRGDQGLSDAPAVGGKKAKASADAGPLPRTGFGPGLLILVGVMSLGGGLVLRRRLTAP